MNIKKTYSKAWQLHTQSKFAEAEILYRKILAESPHDADTLFSFGTMLGQTQQDTEAIKLLTEYIEKKPKHAEALSNLALSLSHSGDLVQAELYLKRALEIKPNYPDALSNYGGILVDLGKDGEAINFARKAIKLEPDNYIYQYNCGLILVKLDRMSEAETCFKKATQLQVNFAEAHNDLGTVYKALGEYDKALSHIKKAIDLKKGNFYDALNNMGATLQEQGEKIKKPDKLREAIQYYDLALEIQPDSHLVKWNKSYLYLALGDLQHGWQYFSYRYAAFNYELAKYPYPQWNGIDSLANKKVLVYGEQGIGDEVWFASCLPDLLVDIKNNQGKCFLACSPKLEALFQRSFPDASVLGKKRDDYSWLREVEPIDYSISIGSLFPAYRSNHSDFPDRLAYLEPDHERVNNWQERLDKISDKVKIGISWTSSLQNTTRNKVFSSLLEWEQIFSLTGVEFVNLQYSECKDEIAAAEEKFGVKIHNFTEVDMFNDLDETAALIKAIDIAIVPDTSVMQLTGGLGVPTLSPYGSLCEWIAMGGVNGYNPTKPSYIYINLTLPINDNNESINLLAKPIQGIVNNGAKAGVPIFEFGLEYFNRGLYNCAKQTFAGIVEKQPNYADAWYFLGLTNMMQKNSEEACGQIKKAIELDPNNVEYHRSYESCLKDLNGVNEKEPTNKLIQARFGPIVFGDSGGKQEKSLELYGEYAFGSVAIQQQLIKPGSWIIETGAGFGYNSVILSMIDGDEGGVIALEADRLEHQRLCANAMLANRMNIHAVQGDSSSLNVEHIQCCDLMVFNMDRTTVDSILALAPIIDKFKPLLFITEVDTDYQNLLDEKLGEVGYRGTVNTISIFNQDNFFKNSSNIFGEAEMISYMGIPSI